MKAAISITGHENNYEKGEDGRVEIPTRLQIYEDNEYPGLEGYLFSYEYKKKSDWRYLTRFTIIAYDSSIRFDRFQDIAGIKTEIVGKTNTGGNFRIGVQPLENEKYRLFIARGTYTINEFEINKSKFKKMETYLRQIKGDK